MATTEANSSMNAAVSPGLESVTNKEAKAFLVFGASVLNDEEDSFFVYTPSPTKPSDNSPRQSAPNGENHNDPQPSSQQAIDTTRTQQIAERLSYSIKGDSRKASSDTIVVEKSKETTYPEEMGVDDKENNRNSNNQKTSHETQEKAGSSLTYAQRSSNDRKSRSSVPSELMLKTQDAIARATFSVSQTMQAPQNQYPKESSSAKEEKSHRDEWKEDLDEAREFYRDLHKKRFAFLQQQRELSSQVSRQKAAYNDVLKGEKLKSIDQETKFNSSVYREYQKVLRENEERRRRESVEKRAKLRKNALEGMERIRMEKVEEDMAILDDRHATSQALQKNKKDIADRRRKSYQFRNGDARRIRNLHEKLQAEQKAREEASYELERQAASDVDKYKRQLEKERRESLANRAKFAHQVRKEEKERTEEFQVKKHVSFELDFAASKDVDEAKRQAEKEKRESLANRNREARSFRQKEAKQNAKETEEQQTSYELKRSADKDVEEYKKKMAEERRESLANRNSERARHAKVMNELELLAREQEKESFVLKWAGESDVKDYITKMKQKRKESLEQRGNEKTRIRRLEEEEWQQEIEKAREDEKLRAEGHKDVEEYRRKCAERDRTSLEYRNKEGRKQRLEEAEARLQERKQEEANFELESMAHQDVEEYVKECKNRRRLSLAFRAKEKRRHLTWKERQEKEEQMERSRTIRGRLVDQRYIELAEQQERAARTIDDLRHQQRIYQNKATNPFRGLAE